MFVAYPPCEVCQWLSSGQLSDQQSFPWLCSLVNQTERPFWRLRKLLQVFWVDKLIGMSPYSNLLNWWVFVKCEPKSITTKRTKDLNYFSLCALNSCNTQVSQFELNYWNKWTFPQHSNLLSCTCISIPCSRAVLPVGCWAVAADVRGSAWPGRSWCFVPWHTFLPTIEST